MIALKDCTATIIAAREARKHEKTIDEALAKWVHEGAMDILRVNVPAPGLELNVLTMLYRAAGWSVSYHVPDPSYPTRDDPSLLRFDPVTMPGDKG